MAKYKPIKIAGFETGLVQEREEFQLVSDAFPTLENAYIWREKLLKKRGKETLGRLRRRFNNYSLPAAGGTPYIVSDILTTIGAKPSEANATVECGTVIIVFDAGGASETTLIDSAVPGTLEFVGSAPDNKIGFVSGTINYITGTISIIYSGAALSVDISFGYYPSLPVMGICFRELIGVSNEETICFDTKYAYTRTANNWQELVLGTTWQGSNSEFFWFTNYWVDATNNKLFWVSNFNNDSVTPDPMRYHNGSAWTDFAPLFTTLDTVWQARIILPFRGRLVMLNTWEGATLDGQVNGVQNSQRIRWSQIGNPIQADSFKQDIRGKGSFLDIPTSEQIISAGYVRDNLVIYCERSTWQLRYVGRDITPFQIERVNNELGAESTFSAVQFDKALLGIGDKRIVSCDSFESEPIDIKIPDLVINIENENNGHKRVHGIRDIKKRLVYWTYPINDPSGPGNTNVTFPNRVLLYNYENDSWANFRDSITTLGQIWLESDPTWEDMGDITWEQADFTWQGEQAQEPKIIGGNQQGYIHKLFRLTSNDPSLFITGITGNVTTATTITAPSHNLETNDIIKIVNIPTGSGYATINDNIFRVDWIDEDNFDIYTYDADVDDWIIPQLEALQTYIGCGEIVVIDNFRVVTKKFHHMDEGKKIKIGYIDTLLDKTDSGEITLKMYVDYQVNSPVNDGTDTFFNVTIPTSENEFSIPGGDNYWHKTFCPVRGNFVQIELTLNNSQMNSSAALSDFTLHAMILHEREAGRLTY